MLIIVTIAKVVKYLGIATNVVVKALVRVIDVLAAKIEAHGSPWALFALLLSLIVILFSQNAIHS